MTAALKLKEDELSRAISESKSAIARLTEERDKVVQNENNTAALAKVVGVE